MRRLKECPDGSTSTTLNYAGLLGNLYWNASPKRCHNSQTSRAQSPLNNFYTWCNMLLTGLPHSPVVSIPLILPSNTSILLLHLTSLLPSPLSAWELGAIIIMLTRSSGGIFNPMVTFVIIFMLHPDVRY